MTNSEDNYQILDDELRQNFRISTEEIQAGKKRKIDRVSNSVVNVESNLTEMIQSVSSNTTDDEA